MVKVVSIMAIPKELFLKPAKPEGHILNCC
jgi:hypothetical protein